MPAALIDLLTAHPVFYAISALEREKLANSAVNRSYMSGEIIVQSGDIWPYLFMMIKGKLEATKMSSEGRSLLVTTFSQGDIFWGLAFFHQEARMPVQLLVREDCQISRWARE